MRAKHAFLEVCKTPDLAVEVSLQPFRRLGVDAIIVFSDILIPAEAMGLAAGTWRCRAKFAGAGAIAEAVRKLRIFDPEIGNRILDGSDPANRSKTAGPEVPVLGFAASPWTLACYMVEGKTKDGFAKVKEFLYAEPQVFRELLHRIAQTTIGYLKAQIAAGAAAVQLFRYVVRRADAGRTIRHLSLPAVQEVISAIRGTVPVIYYTKASHHLLPAVVKAGADVLSVDWRVNLAELRAARWAKSGDTGKSRSGGVVCAARTYSRNDARNSESAWWRRTHLEFGPWHSATHRGRKRADIYYYGPEPFLYRRAIRQD